MAEYTIEQIELPNGDICKLPTSVSDVTVDGTSVVSGGTAEIDLTGKQDKLIAGTNISIDANNVISATGSASGEENVIEIVKVNGTALTPDANKAVDVTVPTVDDELSAGSYNPVQNRVIYIALDRLDAAKKNLQTAVSDPTASGTTISFIDSLSQNENGEIAATKKSVRTASTTQSGLLSAADKIRLENLDSNLANKKDVQTAVSDPTASGTAVSFIDSISQDANGVITPTKKTVRDASTTQSGLMSAADKTTLNNVTSTYLPLAGGTVTGGLTVNGTLTPKGLVNIKNSPHAPAITFYSNDSTGQLGGAVFLSFNQTNSIYRANRFVFRDYTYDSSTGERGSYYESYKLPIVTADMTANVDYDILTSKSPVTVAQGGTGATTALDAMHNLGITYKKYTITRTENSYVNATNVGRISLVRYGPCGYLHFNFAPSTTIPANTATFEIGRFNCTLANAVYQTVPSQAGLTCNIHVELNASGVLKVGNYSTVASATSFYRAMIPVMFADTSN